MAPVSAIPKPTPVYIQPPKEVVSLRARTSRHQLLAHTSTQALKTPALPRKTTPSQGTEACAQAMHAVVSATPISPTRIPLCGARANHGAVNAPAR